MRLADQERRTVRPVLVLLSVAPHLYVGAVGTQEAGSLGFLLGLLIWNLVPVLLGSLLAYSRFQAQGVGWLSATLASSAWAVWAGLLDPQGSTSALIFLFLPAWNVVLVGPAGAMLGALWKRYAARRVLNSW
jgi:hypothetical protein